MKNNFLLILLLSVFIFGCKHDTTKCPKCPPCEKAHVEVTTVATNNTFLAVSDVHIEDTMTGTTYGKVTGTDLWNETKAKIEAFAKKEKPKFMVYLSDLPAYDSRDLNTPENIRKRRKNTHTMLENLRALVVDVPILYLPGNNDSLEGDYHSFADENGNTVLTKDANSSNPWPIINRGSSSMKVMNLDSLHLNFGYYSVDLVDGANTLKVIALNTVIFCSKNSYHSDDLVPQQKAAQDQMYWLDQKLNGLGANDRVMIVMHIPPGMDGYKNTHHGHGEITYSKMWSDALYYTTKDAKGKTVKMELQDAFIQLVADHKQNIVGMLNGHTHLDGLRRVYNSTPKQTPEFVTYSVTTPGIAVNHGNNPGFKMFTYNSSTFDLIDFKTYYASPTNSTEDRDFEYAKDAFYTFREEYNVTDSTATIRSVIENSPTDSLVKYMGKTIGVKSNQHVNNTMNLDTALTVYKQK